MFQFQRVFLILTAWAAITSTAYAAGSSSSELHNRLVKWFAPHTSIDAHQGQYMRQHCDEAAAAAVPDWKGYPVKVCDYTETLFDIPVSTTSYVLFPDAEMLATWIVGACEAARSSNLERCTGRLAARIWYASNAMFPVAGYVVEGPMSADFKYQDRPYCYLFRDGVTVTTASWTDTRVEKDGACGPPSANAEPVATTKLYARIGSTTREAYSLAKGQGDYGGKKSPKWASVVGEEFRRAWSNPSAGNVLLTALVPDLTRCDGNIWDNPIKPVDCK